MKVIGFYTVDTPYEQEAAQFRENVASFGYDVETQGYPNQGAWVRNAGLKPIFISAMLEKHPEHDLLYLDVDARIRRRPSLFDDFNADVGVHYRRGRELLSGTIFLKNNLRVRKMVRDWVQHQQKHPDEWDQRTLQKVLETAHNISIQNIPPQYTQIFDSMKHHGAPVIEHMQASRRYKRVVAVETVEIPHAIDGVRVRRGPDGSYLLSRPCLAAESFLDIHCERVGRQLKWYPKLNPEKHIETLEEYFKGRTVNIVGKGPSLDHLSADDFPNADDPIIAINEAAHVVAKLRLPNPLFGIQQDARLKNTCKPEGVPIFVSVKAANFYAAHSDIYVFSAQKYNLSLNALSVTAAIKITQTLQAATYRLLCFDACVNKKLTYAKAIPYDVTRGGKPSRFHSHRAKIQKHVAGKPLQWVIPTGPA